MTESTITAVLSHQQPWPHRHAVTHLSIGLAVDDRYAVWGDCVLPAEVLAPAVATLKDAITPAFVGQQVEGISISDISQSLQQSPVASNHGLHLGLEQALLLAKARSGQRSLGEVLSEQLGLKRAVTQSSAPLIVEVNNDVASAELIEQMIALIPEGLGYRLVAGDLAESIGAKARYLQRFVRELALVAGEQAPDGTKLPFVYLGLNGALGRLTADAWQALGQVLGIMSGLENAAGKLTIWAEDPVVFEDEVMHSAAMHQLRDYMRLRKMKTRLIARSQTSTLESLQMLVDAEAIDGALLRLEEWPGIAGLMPAVSLLQQAGQSAILAHSHLITDAQLTFLLETARVARAAAVVIAVEEEKGATAATAQMERGRTVAWHQHLRQVAG